MWNSVLMSLSRHSISNSISQLASQAMLHSSECFASGLVYESCYRAVTHYSQKEIRIGVVHKLNYRGVSVSFENTSYNFWRNVLSHFLQVFSLWLDRIPEKNYKFIGNDKKEHQTEFGYYWIKSFI